MSNDSASSAAEFATFAQRCEDIFAGAPELRIDPQLHDYQLTYPPAVAIEQGGEARAPDDDEYRKDVIGELTDTGYYFHFGFCAYRCSYCHHYELQVKQDAEQVRRYIAAMLGDLRRHRALVQPRHVVTFLGGGTPTAIPEAAIAAFLDGYLAILGDAASALSTFEAKPVTATTAKLALFRQAGFERCSMGAQTLDPELYARHHHGEDVAEVRAALGRAREVGIPWLNLDLMVGIEGETPDAIARTIAAVRALVDDGLLDSLFVYPYHDDPRARTYVRHDRCPTQTESMFAESRIRALFDELGWVEFGPRFFRSPAHIRRELEEIMRLKVAVAYGETAWLGFGNSAYSVGDRASYLATRSLAGYIEAVEAGRSPISHFTVLDDVQRAARDLTFAVLYSPWTEHGRIAEKYAVDLSPQLAAFERWSELGLGHIDRRLHNFTLTHDGKLVHQAMLPALYPGADRSRFDAAMQRRRALGRGYRGY